MKALYLDLSCGINGSMIIGALLDLCEGHFDICNELSKLSLFGYEIIVNEKSDNGISGLEVIVDIDDSIEQPLRNIKHVNQLIDDSHFNDNVTSLSKAIFLRIAQAESKLHKLPLDKVYFHEYEVIESIVDIVATAVLIDYLSPDVIYSSIVNDGFGYIPYRYGMLPIPVPATLEIFSHSQVISRQINIEAQLVTPTGAAIISELAEKFMPQPAMVIHNVGWGFGEKNLKIPHVLKAVLGEIQGITNEMIMIETNIDDCTSVMLGYVMDKLYAAGACDVSFIPICLNTNLPAYCLSVTCKKKDQKKIEDIIQTEISTIGILTYKSGLYSLERQ